jgi:hypothetical protein
MQHCTGLFADGGVIGRNPSPAGGTWAYCLVDNDGNRYTERSGWISPKQVGTVAVTNNLTELLALVLGIEAVPDDWCGTVYSDSWVSLQRVFLAASLRNVPPWLVERLQTIQHSGRLDSMRYVLLDGHPTRAHLDAGKGQRGAPVSIHNVWADQTCQRWSAQYTNVAESFVR